MSNNTHIVALSSEEFMDGFDSDNFLDSAGLEIMGDAFETGYVFREQLDTVIGPYLPLPLFEHLMGEGNRTLGEPALHHLTLLAERDSATVIGMTAEMVAQLQAGVAHAIAEADWGFGDSYDWQQFLASNVTGDVYALIEF